MPAKFEQLLRKVRHGQPVTTKYRDFERFLAEVLDINAINIYTTYVAMVGRFDVRMTQSTRARESQVRVALIPRGLDNEVDLAYLKKDGLTHCVRSKSWDRRPLGLRFGLRWTVWLDATLGYKAGGPWT